VSASELVDKLAASKYEYKKQQEMEYILSFFNADETWYKKTKEKIDQIAKSLPKDLDYRKRTIEMYDWIKNDTKITSSLYLPIAGIEYREASVIEMVFNGQIDLYFKILRWD
jgi:hypothetical protein